jgi:hypothetical protein
MNITNNIVINIGGDQIHGMALADMIRHPAAAGAHKKLLEIMDVSGIDFMDLQESFDSAVRAMSNAKRLNHERSCIGEFKDMFVPGKDGKLYCVHSRHGFEHAHQLDVDDIDVLLCEQLMRNPSKFYISHVPQIGTDDLDMRVAHNADARGAFPVVALKKLCENSSVQDLMVFDIADYKPGISSSRYLDYYNQCYEKVLRHMQQDNQMTMRMADRRRRGG